MVNFFKAYFLYRTIAKNYKQYDRIIDEQIEIYEKDVQRNEVRQYPPGSLGDEIVSIKKEYLKILLEMRNTVECIYNTERNCENGKSKKNPFAKIRYFRSKI